MPNYELKFDGELDSPYRDETVRINRLRLFFEVDDETNHPVSLMMICQLEPDSARRLEKYFPIADFVKSGNYTYSFAMINDVMNQYYPEFIANAGNVPDFIGVGDNACLNLNNYRYAGLDTLQ